MRGLIQFFLLAGLLMNSRQAEAQNYSDRFLAHLVLVQDDNGFSTFHPAIESRENARLVAIALDLGLGLFGVHRLYLGTDVKVPVAYTLTFGGGGVLWLVDLALLIASRDIETYKNNPHFFMWIPARKQ
jgi:TM2 domain-containing membrane protein YozV